MNLAIVSLSFVTISYTVFVTLLFLKEDVSIFKRVIGIIILVLLFSLTFYDMRLYRYHITNKYISIISIIISFIVGIYLIIKRIKNRNRISDLSIKNAIDLSSNGIMFFKNKKVVVTNNVMNDILKDLDINNDFFINILQNINQYNLLEALGKVWQVKYDEREIILYDVTDIYNLKKQTEEKNRLIENNNKKLVETFSILEELERKENLVKLKNEFHDLLGSRLSLFSSVLENNKINKEDVKYLINNLFINDEKLSVNELLDNLINMYKILGVNITIDGNLPHGNKKAKVFFEVIREAVTNAIRHANSKNINIMVNEKEMIITNDGLKPNNKIVENEGLKGIRRKVKNINGVVEIDTKDNFKLHITLK